MLTNTQVSRDLPRRIARLLSRRARSTSDGRDRRIHAAGKCTDGAAFADLSADLCDSRIDEMLGGPGGSRSANVECEIAQDIRAERRVMDLGMKLHCPHFAFWILDGSDGIRSLRRQAESGGKFVG